MGPSSSRRTPARHAENASATLAGPTNIGSAQGAGRSPKPALQGSSPWLPAESATEWRVTGPENRGGRGSARGSIPPLSFVSHGSDVHVGFAQRFAKPPGHTVPREFDSLRFLEGPCRDGSKR